jgi:hypothetical protein
MKPLHHDNGNGKDTKADGTKFPRVEQLRRLLGNDVLMLPWPRGSKGTKAKWGHLTVAEMAAPEHLAKLECGNIGIAQGEVSNGLCSIDFDDDEWMQRFLDANPLLAGSLRTRGARGGNVWLRCVGAYPRLFVLKTDDGTKVGEWRATGAQTIISGQHPSGCQYTFTVEAPPVAIAFDQIILPSGLRPPKGISPHASKLPIVHSHSATQKHSHTVTQDTQAVDEIDCVLDVSPFIPTTRHKSDHLLFEMAGALLTWERQRGRKATAAEKQAVFREWWQRAKPHVDPAMDEVAYLAKWLSACKRRKYASDETPVQAAWIAAQTEPPPPEATAAYDPPMSEKMRLLVALCFQLQRVHGEQPFFLTCRDAGCLLETPFTTVHCWLQILADEDGPYRVIKKVSTGSQAARTANEHRYLHI